MLTFALYPFLVLPLQLPFSKAVEQPHGLQLLYISGSPWNISDRASIFLTHLLSIHET